MKSQLFNFLEDKHEEKFALQIIELIGKLYVLDYERVLKFLDSSEFEIRKHAVEVLRFDKAFYTKEDIALAEELLKRLEMSFSKIWKKGTRKKVLSSKLEDIWTCECGNKISDINEYCTRCQKDIFGFKEKEFNPNQAKQLISERLSIMKEQFLK